MQYSNNAIVICNALISTFSTPKHQMSGTVAQVFGYSDNHFYKPVSTFSPERQMVITFGYISG